MALDSLWRLGEHFRHFGWFRDRGEGFLGLEKNGEEAKGVLFFSRKGWMLRVDLDCMGR